MTLSKPTLRLLHTSDVHIGDDWIPERRLASLLAVVDVAIHEAVDVVLIAGDLFDSARVKGHMVEATLQALARLVRPTIIIPGNHDCVDETSIYKRVDLRDAGDHVHFIGDPAGGHLNLERLRLSLWGRGIEDHHPGHKPLHGYAPGADASYWRVAMTHGHFVPGDQETYRSSIIKEAEIARLECDYLALGHWHRFEDVSANGVPAFYCGSPGEDTTEGFAGVNLITLEDGARARVERRRLDLPRD